MKAKGRNGGEKSNKARQGKMPREGNPQSRRKPHREEKRSTEANDEAYPKKTRGKQKHRTRDPSRK